MEINVNVKKPKKTFIRLNILFFIIFILFSTLVIRLGVIQIVYGDSFKREVDRTQDVTVSMPTPRGRILDRNGNSIVYNTPQKAITYIKQLDTTSKQMLATAKKLSKYIDVKTAKVTERDKKDYWILTHPKLAKKKSQWKRKN
ncbi:hypothetical protein RCG23_00345 [Neobacillus sp. PS3-34]|uniref:hypothetical protein n=1 Tax=Neobacillus sp. PS3-34 TaxID=3070678 RepID=UPI0027DFEAC7|nr:hypothetical protein [Neobacillus sp. PS3-34]WML48642.1 hypothetical protein RCG23_00345 [Neobacillus sp. PS3-34]